MGWLYLFIAGIFEVGFTTCLKYSEGFTKLVPTLLFMLFAGISFLLLTRALNTIHLGTAYAIWTGLGAFGTVLVGIFIFNEPVTLLRMVFLGLLITSIIGLKLVAITTS